MILAEPNPTPWDLHFRFFGTPVRVHPLFWLVSGLLGWDVTQHPVLPGGGLGDLALWVGCVFASILLHELGHVWMGRVFHSDGHIVLHGMGGLAVGSNALASRGQRILVSFAGPAIQLVFLAVLIVVLWFHLAPVQQAVVTEVFWRSPLTAMLMMTGGPAPLSEFLWMLLTINLFWPLLNLLPVWPLDGGMISREVCTGASPSKGFLISLRISFLVSALLAVNGLLAVLKQPHIPYLFAGGYTAILFGLFAYYSYRAMQEESSHRYSYRDDDRLPWER